MNARRLILVLLMLLGVETRAYAQQRPNILVFLVDDLGWADSEPYGSTFYETPSINRLAEEGMLFTDAHVTPLCSPTRVSILTGRYTPRTHLTKALGGEARRNPEQAPSMPSSAPPNHKVIEPLQRTYLPLDEITIAEALREGGYNTYHLGKWHVGFPEKYYPHHQGFDRVVGVGGPGPGSYFSPHDIPLLLNGPEGEHITDRLTRETIQILENERVKDGPFFIYLAHHSVHGPWEAKEELTAHYTDKMRKREVPGHQQNPINAAKITTVDASLGRILDRLDALSMSENTLVLFLSDNGGITHIRNPVPVTSNHPLRSGKASIYEGGVRVPMLVRWPGHVETGSKNDDVVHAVDLFPTFLDVAGLRARPEQVLDGESLLPLLTQRGTLRREAIFEHFPHYMGSTGNTPATSVRSGPWKLIRFYGEGPDRTDKHELYNLEDDLGETEDLAAEMPQKVAALSALIDRWLEETGALVPRLNPDYDPSYRTD